MKINIKSTRMELTPAISSYAQKKISAIEKYLTKNNADIVAQVEVGKSTHHHRAGNVFRAEAHIIGKGLNLYAVSEREDLYTAIDVVRDEIIHNAVQSKGRRRTLARRGAEMMKNIARGFSRTFRRRP